jgi:hypothetical protein
VPITDVARYARHSRWSDPGAFASYLDALAGEAARLPEIVGGLMLHPLFAAGRPTGEASLRTASEILAATIGRDTRPLDEARAPDNRVIGTCRNYALLACSILRQHGVAARLRVGFADYFAPGRCEDHWVCEYNDGAAWRLLDAELDAQVRERFAIGFDPADVPRDRFLAAGLAWQAMRSGGIDPDRCGVSFLGIAGLWFAAGSLLRDLAALTMDEMMPWDVWGPGRNFRPGKDISPDWLSRLDNLADGLTSEADPATIVAAHSWAALTSTILSFPEGKPVEVSLVAT